MRFSSNTGGELSSLSHSRVGLAPPPAPAEDSPPTLVGFEEGVGQISQSRDTPLYATLGLSGKPNPHVNARACERTWLVGIRDAATSDKTQGHSKIDRTCCLSTSGFVEETGKCLPKKQECQRKNDKESSTRDPFHYDPAIYPKLRQH